MFTVVSVCVCVCLNTITPEPLEISSIIFSGHGRKGGQVDSGDLTSLTVSVCSSLPFYRHLFL